VHFGNDPQFWEVVRRTTLAALSLIVAISVAILLIHLIRTRYRDNNDPTADETQMLLHVRELRREGDLSEDEYRSIKGRLAKRIDDSMRTTSDNEQVQSAQQPKSTET